MSELPKYTKREWEDEINVAKYREPVKHPEQRRRIKRIADLLGGRLSRDQKEAAKFFSVPVGERR